MVVRWSFGLFPGFPIKENTLNLLELSFLGGKLAFPEARRYMVTLNRGDEESIEKAREVAERVGIEVVEAMPLADKYIKENLQQSNTVWWKFVPHRLAPGEHEVWLDFDVVMWKKPQAMLPWLRNPNSRVMVTGSMPKGGKIYPQLSGSYFRDIYNSKHKGLQVNSGFFGFGPGIDGLPKELPEVDDNEQGYVAASYVECGDTLVPQEDIPLTNYEYVNEDFLRNRASGLHFAGYSRYNRNHAYIDNYLDTVRDIVKKGGER